MIQKKKIIETIIMVVFAAVLGCFCKQGVTILNTEENNVPASDFNILLDMRDGLSDADILAYYKSDIEDVEAITNGGITIDYYDVDLNEDNQMDKIVHIRSALHSGSHGDMLNILIKDGNGYREALTGTYRLFSQWEDDPLGEIYIMESISEGFHDIRMISDGVEIILQYEEDVYHQKENRNLYFFEPETELVSYRVNYSFNSCFSGTADLLITKVRDLEYGEIYELKIADDGLLGENNAYAKDRFHLGYFYVMPTQIYRMNDEKVAIMGTEEEIMTIGTIVCAMWESEDNPEEKGWHEYITLEENRCEYYSYNNLTETGFYESFIWEKGKGLVEYRSGFGAGQDFIRLYGSEETKEENTHSTFPELDYVLGEPEFVEAIESNPIDAAMQWKDDGSTEPRIVFAADYRDAWLAEIENAFTILQEHLTEADYEILHSSYESWLEYMEGELDIEQKIYYPGSAYMEEGAYAGYGMYYPIVMERAANRTKEYAVELLSLEYALTGDVQFIYGQKSIVENSSREICDYLSYDLKEFLEITDYLMWERYDEERYQTEDEHFSFDYTNNKLEYISIDNWTEEEFEWTIFGFSPDMSCTEIAEKLRTMEGVVVESHNMQWYATGIALEKAGIFRLQWGHSNPTGYIDAYVDSELIEKTAELNVSMSEDTYVCIGAEECGTISIKYPVIIVENDTKTTKQIASHIQKTIEEYIQRKRTTVLQGETLNVEYTIRNIMSNNLSISWYCEENMEYEVEAAITCNILDGGRVMELDEHENSVERIIAEIAYREEWEEPEGEWLEKFEKMYCGYYITPLHQVVIYWNEEENEYGSTSLWNMRK